MGRTGDNIVLHCIIPNARQNTWVILKFTCEITLFNQKANTRDVVFSWHLKLSNRHTGEVGNHFTLRENLILLIHEHCLQNLNAEC